MPARVYAFVHVATISDFILFWLCFSTPSRAECSIFDFVSFFSFLYTFTANTWRCFHSSALAMCFDADSRNSYVQVFYSYIQLFFSSRDSAHTRRVSSHVLFGGICCSLPGRSSGQSLWSGDAAEETALPFPGPHWIDWKAASVIPGLTTVTTNPTAERATAFPCCDWLPRILRSLPVYFATPGHRQPPWRNGVQESWWHLQTWSSTTSPFRLCEDAASVGTRTEARIRRRMSRGTTPLPTSRDRQYSGCSRKRGRIGITILFLLLMRTWILLRLTTSIRGHVHD